MSHEAKILDFPEKMQIQRQSSSQEVMISAIIAFYNLENDVDKYFHYEADFPVHPGILSYNPIYIPDQLPGFFFAPKGALTVIVSGYQ